MYSAKLFAIVLLLGSALAADLPLSHQEELEKLNEHAQRIARFPCLGPQPRAVPVHELLSETQTYGKAYYPDVTVLHRCDECGSCESGYTCSPKDPHLVKLPFKVTFLQNMGVHKKEAWKMEYHEFLNHTTCKCAVPLMPGSGLPLLSQ